MHKVRITPPAGAMAHFKRALNEAHWDEAAGDVCINTFSDLGVKVLQRDRDGRRIPRRARAVLDDVVRIMCAGPSVLPGKGYVSAAAALFGEDVAAETIQALRPLHRATYQISGIDVPDERDAPSYDKALLVVRGESPKAAEVAAALGDASPDGPEGNIWKLYDARLAPRTGDWSGVSDRAFITVGTTRGKDTVWRRLGGFVDEVDLNPWEPTAGADAIAKATAPAPNHVERRVTKSDLALLLDVPVTEVDRWIGLGCPVIDGSAITPLRFDVAKVVNWLEALAERDAVKSQGTHEEALRRKAWAEAELAELKLKEASARRGVLA